MTEERLIFELAKLLNILLAAALGFIIGLERKLRSKEAGIRTHTIVCIGSALLMVVSKYAFDEGTADVARVAAQVVSGIGFLGAGVIMFRGKQMHGLTTAAGVWATAGVGMACGGELYIVAVGATVLLVGIQFLTHSNFRLFRVKRFYSIRIKFKNEEDAALKVKDEFGVDRFEHLQIERGEDGVHYGATLKTSVEFSSVQLDEIMSKYPFIVSIERCDEE